MFAKPDERYLIGALPKVSNHLPSRQSYKSYRTLRITIYPDSLLIFCMVQPTMTMLSPYSISIHTPERRDPLRLKQSKEVRKGMGQREGLMMTLERFDSDTQSAYIFEGSEEFAS